MDGLIIRNKVCGSISETVYEESGAITVAARGGLIALSLIFSYLESFIPTYLILPGVKLGLANIVIIYVLYRYGLKEAYIVAILRVLLSTILFGNILTLSYSLAGMLLSIIFMWIAKRVMRLSIVIVSIVGAVFHNLGQCIVAAFFLRSIHIFYYFGFVLLCGVVTGLIIGVLASEMIRRLDVIYMNNISSGGISLEIEREDICIAPGQTVCIVGLNGSGKTTLAHNIAGITEAERLDILYNGAPISQIEGYHRICGLVQQDVKKGTVFECLQDDLDFGYDNLDMDISRRKSNTEKVLRMLPEDMLRKKYTDMSGGELSIAAFASIYSQQPEIMILDEPFAMLGGDEGLDIIRRLKDEYVARDGILIIITHDRNVVGLADRSILVKDGIISEISGSDSLDASDNINDILEGAELYFQSYQMECWRQSINSEIDIISLEDISFAYDDRAIIDHLSASLGNGSIYIIRGVSGAGKTTLLRLIAGFLKPASGRISIESGQSISFVDQFSYNQLFARDVLEEVRMCIASPGVRDMATDIATKELSFWGLDGDILGRDPYLLSIGEKRRLSYACCFAGDADIMFLDEPLVGLDSIYRARLIDRLRLEADKGRTIFITTH